MSLSSPATSLGKSLSWFGRFVFWIGLPLVFLIRLLTPRPRIIYISWEPLSVWVSSRGPHRLALMGEMLINYRSTLTAIGALLLCMFWWRYRRSVRKISTPVWLPICFLPTYVYGIEAVSHLRETMSCHGMTVQRNIWADYLQALFATGIVFLGTVIAGSIAGNLLGHFRRHSGYALVMPPVVLAICLCVGANWFVFWLLFQPLAN